MQGLDPFRNRTHASIARASQHGRVVRDLLLLLIGVLVGANAVYFLLVRDSMPSIAIDAGLPVHAAPSPETTAAASIPTATNDPSTSPPSSTRGYPAVAAPVAIVPSTASAPATSTAATKPSGLLVPVSGIAAAALHDTFDDARGDNRVHEALDIMAPTGTPVLAVADGRVEKLFDSDQGGLTIYQFESTGTYVYYYAHLDRYARGLAEGQQIKRGQVIGFVGSTGNANPAAPHLHFAISVLGPEKRWWKGTAINPYPLLTGDRIE